MKSYLASKMTIKRLADQINKELVDGYEDYFSIRFSTNVGGKAIRYNVYHGNTICASITYDSDKAMVVAMKIGPIGSVHYSDPDLVSDLIQLLYRAMELRSRASRHGL